MGGNYTLPMFISYGLILAFILSNQVHIQSQTTTPSCQPHRDLYPTLAHQQGNDPGPNLTQSPLTLTMNCQLTPPPLQPPQCRWENGPICEPPTETKLATRACLYHRPEICYEFDMQKPRILL